MIILILMLGFLIGSFLNVCIYRIPLEQNISFPPSHCTKCKNRVKSYDLIPVVSYILLKGKCRYCEEKISMRYPLIELITGILFMLIYIKFGLTLNSVKFVVLSCFLIIIGVIDYDTTDVYFSTILLGISAGSIFLLIGAYLHFEVMIYLYGAFLGAGIITVIILLTNGMGWGDVEICALCGLFVGLKLTIVMMFLSFIIGAVAGVLLILLKIKSRKDQIPFGPAIAIAAIITILWGDKLLMMYMNVI